MNLSGCLRQKQDAESKKGNCLEFVHRSQFTSKKAAMFVLVFMVEGITYVGYFSAKNYIDIIAYF